MSGVATAMILSSRIGYLMLSLANVVSPIGRQGVCRLLSTDADSGVDSPGAAI
jgi:hypothetical protein